MSGYRGYVSSRPVAGAQYPQSLQNSLLVSYAARVGISYKLSGTEYAMDHCHMILNQLLEELPRLDGILFFSMYQLPAERAARERVFERITALDKHAHFALENQRLTSVSDAQRLELMLRISEALPLTPFAGHYSKGKPLPPLMD